VQRRITTWTPSADMVSFRRSDRPPPPLLEPLGTQTPAAKSMLPAA
jgi:hypothetical protein